MKRKLTVAFVTLVVTAVGFLVGAFFERGILGIVAGLVIGLPLGWALVTRRRRWAATSILNVWFVLSYMAGGWRAVGYAVAASVLTFFISAAVMRELYGGDEFSALINHFRIFSGLLRGFQIIGEGKSIVPRDASILMGPRLTIVQPNNAVVLERGPRQTRISGPAVFSTEPFEYIKQIYDLQEKQERFTFKDVLTRDLMATTVEVTVNYSIDISDAVKRGDTRLTQDEIARLRRIDARMPEWEQAIKGAIEASVRQAIARCDLAAVLAQPLIAVERNILGDLNNRRIHSWGLRVDEVTVQSIQPEREVIAEKARAVGWRDALVTFADGYRNARAVGMPDQMILREVLRHTFEQIAKDPATKLVFTPEDHRAFADLLGVSGSEQ